MRLSQVVLVVILAMLVVGILPSPVQAQETPQGTPETAGAPSTLWEFLNSPLGISLVGSLLAFILGKVFTAKPEWKRYVDKYRPVLLAAVKHAEKSFPPHEDSGGTSRMNSALQLVRSQLKKKLKEPSLIQAINEVHAEAESVGNV